MLSQEPLSIGGVIDAGVNIFRKSFKATLPTAAAATLPYALVSAAMSGQTAGLETQQDPELALSQAMQGLMLMPLLYAALMFGMAAIIHCQVNLVRDQTTSISEDLICALQRCIPLTIIMLGFIIAVTVGMFLLIIPGLIIAVSMSLFMYTPFMEERSVWSGLARSHTLVWGGNWWRTGIILTVITVLGMVLSAVFYIAVAALAVVESDPSGSNTVFTLETILTWGMMALYLPLTSAMVIALYNDLLLRKEGTDLDTRLEGLDTST